MIELNWGEILVTDNGRFHLTKSSGTFETGARIGNFMADVWKIRIVENPKCQPFYQKSWKFWEENQMVGNGISREDIFENLDVPHEDVLFSGNSGKRRSILQWKCPKIQTGTFGQISGKRRMFPQNHGNYRACLSNLSNCFDTVWHSNIEFSQSSDNHIRITGVEFFL